MLSLSVVATGICTAVNRSIRIAEGVRLLNGEKEIALSPLEERVNHLHRATVEIRIGRVNSCSHWGMVLILR